MGDDHFLNLQPGTVVNGRYEIVKCLGTGSMGMVYACRHKELSGHLVAMKVLFGEVARDEVAAARFRNEIVASYGVNHPHVVRAYEYFKDGELTAFTMEFVGGGDLADRINEEEPIPVSEIVQMMIQMCSGIQAVHDAGIIHRDLKPENILITSNGDIKITDFGIARTGTGPKLTEYGGVVGTIDYVSPEYLEKGQVDTRSDIYSLGVLAYEMITGAAPFKGKSVIETMTMRLRTDPDLPHERRSDCPEELGAIVMKALERDPRERYQTSNEMIGDLMALYEHTEGKKIYDPVLNPKFSVTGDSLETPKAAPEVVSDVEMALVSRAPSPLEQSTSRASAVSQPIGGSSGSQAVVFGESSCGTDLAGSSSSELAPTDLAGTVMLDPASVDLLKAKHGSEEEVSSGTRSGLAEVVEGKGKGEGESDAEDDEFEPEPVYPRTYEPLVDVLPKPQSIAELSKKGSSGPGGNKVEESLNDYRLKELSSEIGSPEEPGFLSTLLKLFLIILFGFIIGVLLIPFLESFLDSGDSEVDLTQGLENNTVFIS